MSGYSLLRFGGSGNDYLTYAFGGMPCPPWSNTTECLNETQWRSLLGFAKAAKARLIFGLSMNTGDDGGRRHRNPSLSTVRTDPFPYPWDPSNARQLLGWTIAHGLDWLLYGLELGNEQNSRYTPAQQVHNFGVLRNLTVELWADESKRPKIFGPDAHSMHGTPQKDETLLEWTAAWLRGSKAAGLPIYGVTHHEYVEVSPNATGFVDASALDRTEEVARKMVATVRAVDADVKVFAGEVGPHNGGSPPCDHSSMRWAVFGDSFWYADSLASKAHAGYEAFCRQDYIGADYGLLDCSTGEPLPDFFTALTFATTMGPIVLSADVYHTVPIDRAVRIYAHCTADAEAGGAPEVGAGGEEGGGGGEGVTLLVINPSNSSLRVHPDSSLGGIDRAYVLSPSDDAATSLTRKPGLLSTNVLLNGKPLMAAEDGTVPPPQPRQMGRAEYVDVPRLSIAFYVMPRAACPRAV